MSSSSKDYRVLSFLRRALPYLLAMLACLPAAHAAQSSPFSSERDTATMITDSDSVSAARPLGVALRLQLRPGWHTYWINPGDAGEAPTFDVQASGGSSGNAHEIAWPAPIRILDSSLMSYAYTGDTVLPVQLHLQPGSGGETIVNAKASWLVCASVCVPEHADFTLTLPAGDGAPSAQATLFSAAAAAVPTQSPFSATVTPEASLVIRGDGLNRARVARAWFMPDEPGIINQAADQPVTVADNVVTITLSRSEGFHADKSLSGVLVLVDRDDRQTALQVTAHPGRTEPAGTSQTILRLLLLAFAGGLILNLMPCVFPVLAMKIVAFTQIGGQDRRAQIEAASFYTLGVVGSFAALGGAMMALREAGSSAGWGFQFQSAMFVTAICWLLFLMALNLLGVFEINAPGMGGQTGQAHGPWGDIVTGFIAVVVATPCTAPFMGVAIAGALGASVLAGIGIFVAMGVGLAAPYLLVALVPRLARLMPRPGVWMQYLRQFLAFPLLGTCVWLLWVAALQNGATAVLLVCTGLLLLGFAAWLFGLAQMMAMKSGARRTIRLLRTGALAAGLTTLALLPGQSRLHQAAPGMNASDGAEPFSPTRLATLRAQGKPVFIDMTAAWCITCLVNQRVALDSSSVRAAFEKTGTVLMRGDWTNRDPQISAFLKEHGRDGVPFYIYFAPHQEGKPLPQILTPALVRDALAP